MTNLVVGLFDEQSRDARGSIEDDRERCLVPIEITPLQSPSTPDDFSFVHEWSKLFDPTLFCLDASREIGHFPGLQQLFQSFDLQGEVMFLSETNQSESRNLDLVWD